MTNLKGFEKTKVSECWIMATVACDLTIKQNENCPVYITYFYYTQGWDWDLVLKMQTNLQGFEEN